MEIEGYGGGRKGGATIVDATDDDEYATKEAVAR